MEKPWLHFKVEYEVVKDWQLYSWKLPMEPSAGTSQVGSREMPMLDKQLRALTSGVTHPWSLLWSREIFLWLSTSRTGLWYDAFHKGIRSSLGLFSPPSRWEVVSDPISLSNLWWLNLFGWYGLCRCKDGWIKTLFAINVPKHQNITVHYFSKYYCWAVNALKPNVS